MSGMVTDHIEAALGPLDKRRLLDNGCGDGALAEALRDRGAIVTGMDPDADAISRARRLLPDVEFIVGKAERLPFAPSSFDGVVFLNSLHHVAPAHMDDALKAAAGVLRGGGKLVVIEPLAEGSFFLALQPIEDETRVRALAQAALDRADTAAGLSMQRTDTLMRDETFSDFDAFGARVSQVNPERKAVIAGTCAALSENFLRHALPTPSGFRLRQPLRVHIFVRT